MLTTGRLETEAFDVSIILNLHDERKYIQRTLLSLVEAAKFARGYGIRIEIVAVLDRPGPGMAQWLEEADLSAFDGAQRHIVDHGSLGPSRNHGIDAARGTYIMTADADDLVSFNYIANFVFVARNGSAAEIYFPRYYYSFGDNFHIYKLLDLDQVSPLSLIDHHPYVSRIFCLRSLAQEIRFEDLRLSRGYAFEDWQFNITAVARGIRFVTVPDTIVFYRQRPGGLMRAADAMSKRLTPPSPFFEPKTYLRICGPYMEELRNGRRHYLTEAQVREEYLGSSTIRELSIAATAIEPGLDFAIATGIYAYPNVNGETRPGARYYEACQVIGDGTFTDVLLVPFLNPGGAEKFILNVIDALVGLDPSRRLLVLSGHDSPHHLWIDRLPPNAVFLDLFDLYRDLGETHRQVATLRILQSVAPGAVLHLKSCYYAAAFIRRFGTLLGDMRIVYYRFCDAVEKLPDGWVQRGYDWDFMSECGELFDLIITDHAAIIRTDTRLLDTLSEKYHPLYLPAPHPSDPLPDRRPETRTLLWASRLDHQKRPDLLPAIARGLKAANVDVMILAFGSPVMDQFDTDLLSGFDNLKYMGPFNGFDQLPWRRCDGLLYTSSFDGLPNIVLEAMAAGLVVFAPDVGGIGEAVTAETGFLIPDPFDDEAHVAAYVAAIQRFYDPATRVDEIRAAARALLARRHDADLFVREVGRVFGVEPAACEQHAVTGSAPGEPPAPMRQDDEPPAIELIPYEADLSEADRLRREVKRLDDALQATRRRAVIRREPVIATREVPAPAPPPIVVEPPDLRRQISALEAEIAAMQREFDSANRILSSRHRTLKHLFRLYRRKIFGRHR